VPEQCGEWCPQCTRRYPAVVGVLQGCWIVPAACAPTGEAFTSRVLIVCFCDETESLKACGEGSAEGETETGPLMTGVARPSRRNVWPAEESFFSRKPGAQLKFGCGSSGDR
jgi:hypothetical protein